MGFNSAFKGLIYFVIKLFGRVAVRPHDTHDFMGSKRVAVL